MKDKGFAILALDTSNYTSSAAVIHRSRKVIFDGRIPLKVNAGERGLRQSHALFQHNQNLPNLIKDCFSQISPSDISAVSVSDKPRPVVGSYMPVFTAGLSCGHVLSYALDAPLLKFSHQEGHLAAAIYKKEISKPYLAFHLSGGTTELLLVEKNSMTKMGGTLDINLGQLIDRVGVRMGLAFPAGNEMDKIASKFYPSTPVDILKPIHFHGLDINLSGVETQAMKWIDDKNPNVDLVSQELLARIGQALVLWIEKAMDRTSCRQIVFMGGVAGSEFIRRIVLDCINQDKCKIVFACPPFSSDNAIGTGLLGADKLWP